MLGFTKRTLGRLDSAIRGTPQVRALRKAARDVGAAREVLERFEPKDSKSMRKSSQAIRNLATKADTAAKDASQLPETGKAYYSGMRQQQAKMRKSMFDATKGKPMPDDYYGAYLDSPAKFDKVDLGTSRKAGMQRSLRRLLNPGMQLEKYMSFRGVGYVSPGAARTSIIPNPLQDYIDDLVALRYMERQGMETNPRTGKFTKSTKEVAQDLRAITNLRTGTEYNPRSKSRVRPDKAPKTVKYKPSPTSRAVRNTGKFLGGLGVLGGADELTRVFKDIEEGDWRGAFAHTVDFGIDAIPGLSLANLGFAAGYGDNTVSGVGDYFIGEDVETSTTSGEDIINYYMGDGENA